MSTGTGNFAICLSLASYLAHAWCGACFLGRHLQEKLWGKGVLAALLFFGYGGMGLFLENRGIPYIAYAVCHHLMLISLTMAVFREKWEKKLLAAVVLLGMTQLIWNFTESFLSFLSLIFLYREYKTGDMAVWGIWVGRILQILTCGIGILAVNLLSKPLSPVFIGKRKSWYLLLAFPLACIIFLMDVANWAASNGILVQERGTYGPYENQILSHGAMCIFTGLAMAAAGFLVFGMERVDWEEKSKEQYRFQVQYYQMLEKQYAQTERLRHDLKNHMIVLENLVQNRQWEHLGNYLKEMAGAGGIGAQSTRAGEEATGSFAMDALLCQKKCQAVESGIDWKCDIRMPKDCPVKEMDLCIIAGNILDNAIEACCRIPKDSSDDLKFIQIYMNTIKQCLLLEVKNSTDLKNKGEIGKSRKEDGRNHGIGLANVRAAAADYNGAVQAEVENGIFTMSVLIPLYRENTG